MFKINIQSQIHGERWLTKETQAEVGVYLAEIQANEHWGKNAYSIPEVKDEQGNVVSEAQSFEAEYSVTVEDVSAEVEQERINAEALAYLAETDYMVIRAIENPSKPVPEEIALARQAARDRIVR